MTSLHLLLISLCVISALSNEYINETQADLPQEQPENSENQETLTSVDHELNSSTLNLSQDCCSSLYNIGRDVGVLSETVRRTNSRLEETLRRLEETTLRLEASDAQLNALNNTLFTVLNKERIHVAFTASHPLQGTLTAGTEDRPIVYRNVETNLGNAYSPVTGFFTAPVRGIYSFSFTSFYWGSSSLTSGGSLCRNRVRVVSWYHGTSPNPTSGSNSAVLLLNAGDQVNVYLWSSRTIADNGNKYSSFSGFLLYAL